MKRSLVLFTILVVIIACLISCDLFSLEDWFDFATKAVITSNDTSDIHIGEAVSLDGSTSECGMNETLIYTWEIAEKPLGSIATLDHPTSKTSSFTPDYAGTYIISLTVVDDDEDSNNCNYSIDVSAIITASAGTGGSITPSGAVSVTQGSDKTFTITPEIGYEITDIVVDDSSIGAVSTYTFSDVSENHTINATFSLVDYVISASAGTGGSISPNGDVSVTYGSDKAFTITSETGYEVFDVLVDGKSVGAVTSHTFNDVTENHTISATFSLVDYVITASAGTGGSINPSGDVSVTHGDDQTFTLTPETGYEVSDVLVDEVSVGAVTSYTFYDVTENHTISASFLLVEYVITASAGTGGSINPSGDVSVTHGDDQTFTITPNTGYEISDVLVDGLSVGAVISYTFIDVTENHTINASFSLVEYVITVSAGTGGSITPNGDVSVTHGSNKTFTITSETGYEVSDVLIDGSSVGAVTSHTFYDVTENHTISALFTLIEYVITASAGTGGNISPSGDVSITHGSDKTYTITPNTGYEISDVLVDGSSVGAVTSHTFNDVTENHTISVTFSQSEFTITFIKNAADATGTMSSETVKSGDAISLPTVGYTRVGYTFSGWATSSEGIVVYANQASFTMDSSDMTLYAIWTRKEYAIGTVGPGGGYVFYDKGSDVDGWRYIEAAPYGWFDGGDDPLMIWGGYGISIGTAESVGTGRNNTELIVNELGNNYYAAKICESAIINDLSDWFLPSIEEVNLMYDILLLNNLGNLLNEYDYWSSSDSDSISHALSKLFSNGGVMGELKNTHNWVRPVRYF